MAAKKSLKCQTLMFQTFKGIEKRDVPRQGSSGQAMAQGPSPWSQGGVGGSAKTRGAPASKVGRNWPSGSSFVPCRLALIQLYPPSAMRCPLLHPKSVRSARIIFFFFLKHPSEKGRVPGGGLQDARNTCTWMGKVHVSGAGSCSLPGLNAQQTHLNPPRESSLEPGRVPTSSGPTVPPSASAGTLRAPPPLQYYLSRTGSAAGQPQREKTAIASPLISPCGGWRDTRGVGAGKGVARTVQEGHPWVSA